MANKVIFNQNEGRVLLRFDANGTIALANLATSNTETVTGAVITQVAWSGSNTWTIARGSNTVLELSGTDHWNLAASGIAQSEDATGSLVITNLAADPGTLLLEVKKY